MTRPDDARTAMDRLITRSSFGGPATKRLRARTPATVTVVLLRAVTKEPMSGSDVTTPYRRSKR